MGDFSPLIDPEMCPGVFPIKRSTDQDDRNTKRSASVAQAEESSDGGKEGPKISMCLPDLSGMKLKQCDLGTATMLMKLPRFGEKLMTAPSDVDQLQLRVSKIYRCKYEAFKWPRHREIIVRDGTEQAATKIGEGMEGRLDGDTMTVEVARFRGAFHPYFGQQMKTATGQQACQLSPFEAFFLLDTGVLEVYVELSSIGEERKKCVLAVEDVRAAMEAKVPNFTRRYALFSEIHRSTQLYAKDYGLVRKAKTEKRQPKSQLDKIPLPDRNDDISLASVPSTSSNPFLTDPVFLSTITLPDEMTVESTQTLRSTEDASMMLGQAETPLPIRTTPPAVSTAAVSLKPLEIPPFSFSRAKLSQWRRGEQEKSPAVSPESFDVAFTCYNKMAGLTGPPQFDVALVDFRRRDIPIADLFTALEQRSDPGLPLYVAKEDHGQLTGFAAVLADVPVVCYEESSSDP